MFFVLIPLRIFLSPSFCDHLYYYSFQINIIWKKPNYRVGFFSVRRTLLRQGRQWMINIVHSFCLSYWYDMTLWMRMTSFLGGTDMNRGKQAMVIKTYHLYQYLIGSASGREEPQTCILSWLNKRLLRAPGSIWVELYQAQSHSQTLKLSFSENMISISQVPNTSPTRHLSLVTSPSLFRGITLHFKN